MGLVSNAFAFFSQKTEPAFTTNAAGETVNMFQLHQDSLTDSEKLMQDLMTEFHNKTGYVPEQFENSDSKFFVVGLTARNLQTLVVNVLGPKIFGFGRSDFKNYIQVDLRPLDGLGMLHKFCFDVNDNVVNYYD